MASAERTGNRERILAEAYRQFVTSGFDRATTAAICRGAGVSSGTFFHYFPTKLALLVALLEDGAAATRERLERIERADAGLPAVIAFARSVGSEIEGEGFGGLLAAVAAVEHAAEVAAVLADEEALVTGFLERQLELAADRGELRAGVPVERAARWVQWLLDGAAARGGSEADASGLVGAVRELLADR